MNSFPVAENARFRHRIMRRDTTATESCGRDTIRMTRTPDGLLAIADRHANEGNFEASEFFLMMAENAEPLEIEIDFEPLG